MHYRLQEDPAIPGTWRVELIEDGRVVAALTCTGPDAERRARRYAESATSARAA